MPPKRRQSISPGPPGPASVRAGGGKVECRVERDSDVYVVQRAARQIAGLRGFPRQQCIEIAIAASELTSNILKHGPPGAVLVEAVDDPARGPGVRVTARDSGPPFRDFELAMRDGFDDTGPLDPATIVGRRGFGSGLGAVRRFSDELGWSPRDHGKEVWFVRYRSHSARHGTLTGR